jgi:hypothetical protein
MFTKISVFILILTGLSFAFVPADSSDAEEFRVLENKAFDVGERLTFNLNYGFVTAGVATMHIPRTRRISGREVYQITFEVNSVPSFDWFYKVRDRYESYLDVKGLFPWRFEQHIREGSYSRDFAAIFDHRRGIAKTSEGEYEIPLYVNDIVSAFFYARTLDYSNMKIDDRIHLQNFYKDKVHELDVKYLGKETITVPAGTFDCIVVEPLVKEGGLFKHEGTIIVWLSDDDIKLPVKVKTKVVIGSVDANLSNYEGLKGNLTSRRN